MCVCAWMLAPLSLLTCWITPLKSLSPDSAWTLPVCLETSICQSLSCTHTHVQSCSVPPIEAELSVQIKEVHSLQWYCQMQDSTVPRIPSLASDALYGLLQRAQVEMWGAEESRVRIYAYICFWFLILTSGDGKNERMKERSMLLNFSCKHSISWSVGWYYQTILAHHRYFRISRYIFWGGVLKNIVQEMMLGVICNYCIYYIWSESVSVPAPASIG